MTHGIRERSTVLDICCDARISKKYCFHFELPKRAFEVRRDEIFVDGIDRGGVHKLRLGGGPEFNVGSLGAVFSQAARLHTAGD